VIGPVSEFSRNPKLVAAGVPTNPVYLTSFAQREFRRMSQAPKRVGRHDIGHSRRDTVRFHDNDGSI
jgi:hypothetical protein